MTTRPPPARAVVLGILPLLLLASACATAPSRGPFAEGVECTEVEVFNERWEDLTVYLVRDGMYHRLGRVTGKTSRVLTVPRHIALCHGWMTLVAAHPDRKPHARSAEFQLLPGERAHWTIELYSGPSPVVY